MTDTFEDFGEQQQSYELLEQHREQLAAEAAEIVRDHPGARPVGVVMDSAAPEAAEFLRSLQEQTGQPVAGFVGVMPREMVLDLLRANHPAMLDWLPDSDQEGPDRILPLVALTEGGVRAGQVGYRLAD